MAEFLVFGGGRPGFRIGLKGMDVLVFEKKKSLESWKSQTRKK